LDPALAARADDPRLGGHQHHLGHPRELPRHRARLALARPALDVRHTGRLSDQRGPALVEASVPAQPDGAHHRRIPAGPHPGLPAGHRGARRERSHHLDVDGHCAGHLPPGRAHVRRRHLRNPTSMSDITIELNNVAKRYRLRRGWYVTSIRDEMERLTARLLRRYGEPREEFWALRNVTFSLKRGEVLGLVGPNGAGKRTILKILSRGTGPTAGPFVVHGRLGALIEIGAGFHPELTGRENIALNGVILGMSRREIRSKFDRIVAFAELERFIDTPIKHYSSGMQMRLGFAVAAHIDPDVLLIDEILAVGDASFQAKCANKIAELKEQDKTIILCSHELTNITDHCKSVLWVEGGRVRMLGETDAVLDAYLEHVTATMNAEAEHAQQ